uniref:Tektin n=1 Tax=Heliothis virescens TaxID=7102 RepID=A0A2A4KA34_HELVI
METTLTTFVEKDMCPVITEELGAFIKAQRASKPPKIEEVQISEEDAKAKAEKKHAMEARLKDPPPPPPPRIEEAGPSRKELIGQELAALKPGPDGKVDWTPLGELTGTRPPVNKYSISRYSLQEWRKHNDKVLSPDIVTESNIIDYNAKTSMMQAFGTIDKQQLENDRRLKQKARDIYRWKVEVERACKMITEEVELLEVERQRLKGASRVLMLPESISRQCIEMRTHRSEPDLVADLAEEQLVKEMNLVNEVRETLKTTLNKIEEQLKMNKAAKHRIEYDWCDKTMAYNTDTLNLSLNTKSNTLLFRPGATRFGDFTAPLEYWEFFCRETIENIETVRQKSEDLRSSLNAILINNGRKLRIQADKTDVALAETVALTTELCTKLKERLLATLQKIADMEVLIQELQDAVKKTDAAMKLAQTRLDNRNNWRPHGENVRDQSHLGLIEEVKKIHETVTSLLGQIRNAERVRQDLIAKRKELENDIASKNKTLIIDRERCGKVRSHYPSASELAGF